MKCPLFEMAGLINYDRVSQIDMECSKEACQWYNASINACAVFLIPRELDEIREMVKVIMKKMPHGGQFTK